LLVAHRPRRRRIWASAVRPARSTSLNASLSSASSQGNLCLTAPTWSTISLTRVPRHHGAPGRSASALRRPPSTGMSDLDGMRMSSAVVWPGMLQTPAVMPARDDHQAGPRLAGVAQIPEQGGGRRPDEEQALDRREQDAVDKGQCRREDPVGGRSVEGKPPAGERAAASGPSMRVRRTTLETRVLIAYWAAGDPRAARASGSSGQRSKRLRRLLDVSFGDT
jgi:hypothetical protein